jgi:hypothetical protein
MERLEGPIRNELGRLGPGEGNMVGIVRAWPAAVGETLARNAWPARVQRDGTLLVHTVSSIWAFELGRMAGDVLERLRAEAGEDAPAALRFAPGPVPEPQSPAPADRDRALLEVDPDDTAEAARIAAAVEDEDLRSLVARAVAASLARARQEAGSGRTF